MPGWDLFFKIGADTKPMKQDLERAGAHMEAAGKKIGKRFGLSWSNALAGVALSAAAAIGAAFRGALTDAVENLRGAARLNLPISDFAQLKALAEETGVAVDTLAEALKKGGADAEHLRKQMDETRKGLVEQPDWATGWLKAMSNAVGTGWQSFKNIVGTVGAAGAATASAGAGAIKGGVKGIGALLSGGGLSGFTEELSQGIAEGLTAGDTAETRARVMTAGAKIVEDKAKRKKKDDDKVPTMRKGVEMGVSADALSQVGIMTSRFGMNARTEKWQDEMLATTKQIAANTGAGNTSAPPGPITP